MIGYVTLGTNDLPRAAAFYDALLAEIGAKRLMDFGRGIAWGVAMDTFTRRARTEGTRSCRVIFSKSPPQASWAWRNSSSVRSTTVRSPNVSMYL